MGIYATEIDCPLCGQKHSGTFWSLNMSVTSGGYGRCAGRSLLLGTLHARMGIAAAKTIRIIDGHLSLFSGGIVRDIPRARHMRTHVDEYKAPTLGDLLPKVRQ